MDELDGCVLYALLTTELAIEMEEVDCILEQLKHGLFIEDDGLGFPTLDGCEDVKPPLDDHHVLFRQLIHRCECSSEDDASDFTAVVPSRLQERAEQLHDVWAYLITRTQEALHDELQ